MVRTVANLRAPMAEQGVSLSMKTAPDSARGAALWLKRLWPLMVLLAATAFVFAMGWHRYLTIGALADRKSVV